MSDVWNKKHQAWRLPDPPQNGDGKPGAASSNAAGAAGGADFDLTFTGRKVLSRDVPPPPPPPSSVSPTSAAAPAAASKPQFPASPLPTEQTASNIVGLEVGAPGQFVTKNFEHGTNLDTQSGQAPRNQGSDSIMMLDDPLPESLSGGAGLQEMFVAEVLKGAQSAGLAFGSGPEAIPTLVAEMPEIMQAARPSAPVSPPSPPSSADENTVPGLELSRVTSMASGQVNTSIDFVTQPFNQQPPQASALNSASGNANTSASNTFTGNANTSAGNTQTSTQTVSKTNATKVERDDKSKSGGATKSGTSVTKAGAKKPANASSQKGTGKNLNGEPNAATNLNPNGPVVPGAVKGLSKEVRVVIGVVIVALIVLSAAIFKQMTTVTNTQQMSTMIEKPTEAAKTQTPSSSTSSAAKSDGQAKVDGKQKTKAPTTSPGDDDIDDLGDDLDYMNVLTRPVSRYTENNRALEPLIDLNAALDRVLPRKAMSLMRSLPENFASTDAVQKTALRELTARFYMQVSAYQKAAILFRQTCADPAKTSDVEICLHAARAFVVMGDLEDAKSILNALGVRLVGQHSQWREWVKLLEVSMGMVNLNTETLLAFTDDFVDKAPFLTTEWNLQLATLFARSFMKASDDVRIDYLQQISGSRKKSIEVRLAPDKYGSDIGSYMLSAFLNLMLRHYEFPQLNLFGDEPDTDSETSMISWVFNVISVAKWNEPRETRARLAPLFAERAFASLARLIEGQLAAQAGDYFGAQAMILEQMGPSMQQEMQRADRRVGRLQAMQFLTVSQRLRSMPFLHVEWIYLGIKVSSGINDRESLKTYLAALEEVRKRTPEIAKDLQYWLMYSRGQRILGDEAAVETAVAQAAQLAVSKHDLGFIGADRVWLLMKKGQKKEAKELMRQLLREIPHHARLLELAAEYSAPWGEEPSTYLRLEAEIPQRYQTRGRDSVLLSMFTIQKLLGYF